MAEKKPHTEQKVYGVYIKSLLNAKVALSIREIGQNIRQNLEKKIAAKVEGKCGIEGFIQPKSVNVKTYSNGVINMGFVEFQVVFECMVCSPVEGMLIECVAKTITKAGIHAEVIGKDGIVPITAHIARDHNYNDIRFNNVKEKDTIMVKVIGVRYELNDPCIDVIGKVVEKRERQPEKRTSLKIGGFFEQAEQFIEELEYYSTDGEDL